MFSRVSTQGGASRQARAHGSRLVVCLHKAMHPDRPGLNGSRLVVCLHKAVHPDKPGLTVHV